ncbi:hypothetical protein FQA39_LY07741 [Lamprigera yunnana]|nr:hypothetical protein FQA39_LY07741 [Lamprigera yunnana]
MKSLINITCGSSNIFPFQFERVVRLSQIFACLDSLSVRKMANNKTKTPAMVLQELAVRKGWISPEYTIIHSKEGTHENEFHYKVIVESVVARGVGRSKQIAKHEAANNALEKLAALNIYTPDETVLKAPRSEGINSPIKLAVNCIGSLNEICSEYKVPLPTFIQVSDVGPPHCKEFTYDCKIASICTRATSGTKKQAKQLAAKDMIERVMQALPELLESLNASTSSRAIVDSDHEAYETYKSIKKLGKPKPNLSLKIEDYDRHLKNIVQEKGLNLDIVRGYLHKQRDETTLKELLTFLELDYCIETLQKNPYAVVLIINTDVPFTVLSTDSSYDECVKKVLRKTYEDLEILLN